MRLLHDWAFRQHVGLLPLRTYHLLWQKAVVQRSPPGHHRFPRPKPLQGDQRPASFAVLGNFQHLPREQGRMRPVRGAKLAEDVAQVNLYRRLAHPKLVRYELVGLAHTQAAQYI